jgi:preprotein translocase subunit SecG
VVRDPLSVTPKSRSRSCIQDFEILASPKPPASLTSHFSPLTSHLSPLTPIRRPADPPTHQHALYNRPTLRHIPPLMWLSILIPVLLVILAIVCFLLVFVVLMQRPKNEGLGAAFGSGVTENIFGAQTTTVLTKATLYLGGAFFILTLILTTLTARQSMSGRTGLLEAEARKAVPVASPSPPATAAASETPAASPNANVSPTPSASPNASVSPSASPK